ncbi:TIGR03862 family flavoprotein [Pseudomonas luteola]|uniref:TIGR03862 family flavoprotein n=1 Tax=Pseudomonas luteola TaxID=47886 RepID=UPI00123B15E4|nr:MULTISPECIES: TIGR03862 family flavoprotein [Pseudomonas]MBA1249425.1 TIGR03862 family flavoprotein [Pseudomonas zeshuii]QEU29850.1 TIGR03862 family flavoprotein [Pseudomonas luteola]
MSPHVPTHSRTAAIIGGGPAGLMAAEVLAGTGVTVDVYDGMPSVGRKFLLAGVGGMNITHAEDQPAFRSRYRERETALSRCLDGFDSHSLRDWIHGLGIETFVGSSGRVFPTDMKAAPLLRAWLHRLREAGVRIHTRHRWLGWDEHGALRFSTPAGETCLRAGATVLALGGASWPRLGSDGVWTGYLEEQGIALVPLQPANCGFEVAQWSDHLRSKFAGSPIKPVAMMLKDGTRRQGEFVLTETGIEGSLIYALSAEIRTELLRTGSATLYLDLAPTKEQSALAAALSKPRKGKSMANHLRAHAGLEGARSALLRELAPAKAFDDMQHLAAAIKSLPLTVIRPRPIEEAISSAGGVPFETLNEQLMLNALPGVFCAGEMLDWEAPTGGYLLTACFATGRTAGLGAAAWLQQ